MIEIISTKKALDIINTKKPIGRFLIFENNSFTGIDNETGDAWAENFKTLKGCLKWLNDQELEEC